MGSADSKNAPVDNKNTQRRKTPSDLRFPPDTGFIPPPNPYRSFLRPLFADFRHLGWEVFLYSSMANRFCSYDEAGPKVRQNRVTCQEAPTFTNFQQESCDFFHRTGLGEKRPNKSCLRGQEFRGVGKSAFWRYARRRSPDSSVSACSGLGLRPALGRRGVDLAAKPFYPRPPLFGWLELWPRDS